MQTISNKQATAFQQQMLSKSLHGLCTGHTHCCKQLRLKATTLSGSLTFGSGLGNLTTNYAAKIIFLIVFSVPPPRYSLFCWLCMCVCSSKQPKRQMLWKRHRYKLHSLRIDVNYTVTVLTSPIRNDGCNPPALLQCSSY